MSEIDNLLFSIIGNTNPIKSFLHFLELTLGYTYDKDVGILQVSLHKDIDYIVKNADDITGLFTQLNQSNMEYLTFLFLLIVCKDKNIKDKIGKDIFDQFLTTIDLSKIDMKSKSVAKKSEAKIHINPLYYTGDSCYMDSSLVALLMTQNDIVDETILYTDTLPELREELVNITKSLRGEVKEENVVRKVTNLRAIIKTLDPPQPFYRHGAQNDASEFITWIFDLFNVNVATLYQTTFFSNDNKNFVNYSNYVTKERPIIPITSDELGDEKKLLSFFIKKIQKSTFEKTDYVKKTDPDTGDILSFKYMVQIVKLESPFYIFDVKRRGTGRKFNNTQIIAPEFIFIKNFKTIELSSIVIHTGGAHYVCVFKYNDDNWYYYNDNPGGKRPIVTLLGNYKAMIKKSPYNPFTNGTLFFYKSNSLKDLSEELSEEVSEELLEEVSQEDE
jgi:hypothetical protein